MMKKAENSVTINENKSLASRLIDKKFEKIKKSNQPIFIKDLIVKPDLSNEKSRFGEASVPIKPYQASKPVEARLRGHIQSLLSLANEEHRLNYCAKDQNSQFIIQPGKENHITRLSTTEFSFYTKSPLTTQQFNALYDDIANMAKTLEPNVHALLSSFSVVNNLGEVLNMGIYVEGGPQSKVHCFSKNTASHIDIDYRGTPLFSQRRRAYNPQHKTREITASSSGETVYTGSVFECKTAGGAHFTQMIDVCLDHAHGHSKQQFENHIRTTDQIIPEQIEQCVTSCSIELQEGSAVSDNVVHADPYASYSARLENKNLFTKNINKIISNDFPDMRISKNATGYSLRKPPFGSNFSVKVYAERPAGTYKPEIREKISESNQRIIKEQVTTNFQSKNTVVKLSDIEDRRIKICTESKNITNQITKFFQTLLKKCQPSLWQRFFRTSEYKEKMEARALLKNKIDYLKGMRLEDWVNLSNSWLKDFRMRTDQLGSSPIHSSLKKDFLEEVTKSSDELKVTMALLLKAPTDNLENNKVGPSNTS